MTANHPFSPPVGGPDGADRLHWPATLGFGAMGLLWPVVDLTGMLDLLGPVPSIVLAVALPGAAWILGAAYGGVPRPLLTLTLAGALTGVILVVWSFARGHWPEVAVGYVVAGAAIEILRSTMLGALAGVVAVALRRAHRPRR